MNLRFYGKFNVGFRVIVSVAFHYTHRGVQCVTLNFKLVFLWLGFPHGYLIRPEPLRVRWDSDQHRSYK